MARRESRTGPPGKDAPAVLYPLILGALGLGGLAFFWGYRKMTRPDDPTNVLPDKALFGYTHRNVQAFLESRKSYLAHKTVPTSIGDTLLSFWIEKNCSALNITSEWVLVRLQCEQGLIETSPERAMALATKPKTWKEYDAATGTMKDVSGTALDYMERWALGFSAFESGFRPVLNGILMAGLPNQIEQMVKWSRRVAENTANRIPVEQVDGETIQPKTRATYALYRYTPHLSAAKETQAVFTKYFPELTYQG